MSEYPTLGSNLPGESRCTRMLDEGPCMRPGELHIIWEGNLSSQACGNCAEFALNNREYKDIHETVEWCLSPRGRWFFNEGTCREPQHENDWEISELVFDK